jgi:cytochrome c55X
MKGRARIALLCALAGAGSAACAQPATPDAVEAGRRLYVSSCTRCHGINLVTNGIGFDLRTIPQADKERFVRSVTQGKGAMPAWGGTLKVEQLDLIWSYIGSVNGWKAEAQAQE